MAMSQPQLQYHCSSGWENGKSRLGPWPLGDTVSTMARSRRLVERLTSGEARRAQSTRSKAWEGLNGDCGQGRPQMACEAREELRPSPSQKRLLHLP